MRIYTLAKELGERFNLTIKSSDLAEEIRQMPEFAPIKDSIKSHASSIEEKVAARITEIYHERHEAPKKEAAREALARKKEEREIRRREILERRNQADREKAAGSEQLKVASARQLRAEEMKRRQAMGQTPPPVRPRPQVVQPEESPQLGRPRLKAVPLPTLKVPRSTPAPPPAAPGVEPAQAAPPPTAAGSVAPVAKPAETSALLKAPAPSPAIQRGLRSDGQPLPPSSPKLGDRSPFRVRPTTPRAPVRPQEQGRAPSSREAPQRPSDEGRRRPGAASPRGRPSDELVLPEIGVMTLKSGPGGRRGREKARTPTGRKKGLKTIVREEIEVKPSKVYGLADQFRRPLKRGRGAAQRSAGGGGRTREKEKPKPKGPIVLGSLMTVGQFAEKVCEPAAEVIKRALLMGQQITINQLMEPDLSELIAQDLGLEIVMQEEGDEQDVEQYRPEVNEANLAPRPPVVTIMGHVDHGKTTLLDAYRRSNVIASEAGGMTQHIGAYHVETPRGDVIFLDTPGHEAFTAMRARGAKATDLIVLVVAADDGVMPQTVEAINHAREANVPIIVAINKIDLPGASPERVRNELMQHSIVPESLGGDTIFVEISAKEKTNLDELLEMIHLQAEVLELKADAECHAEGVVIESHLNSMRGAGATILVKHGTLRLGDVFVVGVQNGRVRVMIDDRGRQVKEAGPSRPVEVYGLSGPAEVGEMFLVMPEERRAREIASRRTDRRRMRDLGMTRHVTLEGLHDLVEKGKLKDLKVILKADVQGSIEAVSQSLTKLSNEEVNLRILHQATGAITENDVNFADASDAIIVGFNVRPDPAAASMAEKNGVEIKTYRIIYEVIEEFQKAIIGMLDKRYREVQLGRVEVRQIFKVSRLGNIAGCMVVEGEIARNSDVRVVRDGVIVYEGKLASLRRVKDDAAKVASGFECGIVLENFRDVKEGDVIEAFTMEEIPVELAATSS